jgi:chemotaxis protein histidine kinase CheA
MGQARAARLALKNIRIDVVNKHKELKEHSLREGQTLDLIKRRLVGFIEPTETLLQEQEDFPIIQEKKRIEALTNERIKLLEPYVGEQAKIMSLGLLHAEAFKSMVDGYKLAKEQREREDAKALKDEIEAKLKNENEQAQIKAENEKLKAEQKKNEEKLYKERAEKKKLEDAIKAKAEKEEQEQKEKAASERKAKRAPDKDKLLTLAESLGQLPLPSMKDEEAQEILNNVKGLLGKVQKYICSKAESL